MEKDKKPTYKYCIVPLCKNTIRNSPDKLFFLVPRGADIRRKWCENMKRHMVSPSTCLYCCEDHFNIKEDTHNYVEYQIMSSQMKQKSTLRLKKGILPHKFDCQKDIEAQPPLTGQRFQKRKLDITKNESKKSAHTNISLQNKYLESSTSTSLSHTLIHTDDIGKKSIREDGGFSSLPYEPSTSTSLSHTLTYREEFEKKSVCEAGGNPSLSNTIYVDKAIQVKSKPHYRSKSVNVNITAKTKNIAVSPLAISSKTISTSPVKIASRSGFKRSLFQDNSADIVSVSSTQPSVSSSSFEPEISSPGSSLVEDLDSETRFKNQMRCCMLTDIEKEPKMMIGLTSKQDSEESCSTEHEVGIITEPPTGIQDPLANNSDRCRFCANITKKCVDAIDKPYLKNNKIALMLNDINVEIDFNVTQKVCLDCDRQLLEMYTFVILVKNAQDKLINARNEDETEALVVKTQDRLLNSSYDTEAETLVVKTECESPTSDNDEIDNEETKEGIVDSITIGETAFVKTDVFIHKKRKCDKDTKKISKPQKKQKVDDKVTCESTELIIDIKEEPTEGNDDAITDIHEAIDSEDGDTGPDVKLSELDIATNALLNEMADDGVS